MLLTLIVAVFAAATSPAASTQTQLPARAAVFTIGKGAGAQADQAQLSLTRALAEAKVPLADVSTLFAPTGPANTSAQLLTEGLTALENLDTVAAGQKFQEALAFLERNPGLADTKTLTQLHLLLGTIALQSGKAGKKRGADEVMRAAVLDPNFVLDPKYFSPDIKKEWAKALKELEAKPKSQLTFDSAPQGAEVIFQGQSMGATPISAGTAVAAGQHLVNFRLPGYAPAGLLLAVSGETRAKGELSPVAGYAAQKTQMNEVLPGNFGGTQVPNAAISVAEAMKSRFLVVAEVDPTGNGQLEVWDAAKGNRLKDVRLVSGQFGSAAEQVKRFIDHPAPLEISGGEGPVATASASNDEPLTKKWWFWAAIGVVVVGAAATGIAVAASNGNTLSPSLSGTF